MAFGWDMKDTLLCLVTEVLHEVSERQRSESFGGLHNTLVGVMGGFKCLRALCNIVHCALCTECKWIWRCIIGRKVAYPAHEERDISQNNEYLTTNNHDLCCELSIAMIT